MRYRASEKLEIIRLVERSSRPKRKNSGTALSSYKNMRKLDADLRLTASADRISKAFQDEASGQTKPSEPKPGS